MSAPIYTETCYSAPTMTTIQWGEYVGRLAIVEFLAFVPERILPTVALRVRVIDRVTGEDVAQLEGVTSDLPFYNICLSLGPGAVFAGRVEGEPNSRGATHMLDMPWADEELVLAGALARLRLTAV